MPRIPPTPGLVGFDFGYKPAVMLAFPPGKELVKQQGEDERHPCPLNSSVYALIINFTGCGCIQNILLEWVAVTGHTDIDLPDPIEIPIITPGTSEFLAVVGTVTVQKYTASGCATPDGAPFDVDVKLFISCDGTGLTLLGTAPGANLPAGGAWFVGSGQFGEEIANTIDCADSVAFVVDSIIVSRTT